MLQFVHFRWISLVKGDRLFTVQVLQLAEFVFRQGNSEAVGSKACGWVDGVMIWPKGQHHWSLCSHCVAGLQFLQLYLWQHRLSQVSNTKVAMANGNMTQHVLCGGVHRNTRFFFVSCVYALPHIVNQALDPSIPT